MAFHLHNRKCDVCGLPGTNGELKMALVKAEPMTTANRLAPHYSSLDKEILEIAHKLSRQLLLMKGQQSSMGLELWEMRQSLLHSNVSRCLSKGFTYFRSFQKLLVKYFSAIRNLWIYQFCSTGLFSFNP